MKNISGADGPQIAFWSWPFSCPARLKVFCVLGWGSTYLSCWQFNQPGQVPGIHRSDPGSRKGPVQVLGLPLPAGGKCGCSDGRAGLEQSRVTEEGLKKTCLFQSDPSRPNAPP